MTLPPRTSILGVTKNKVQLNKMLAVAIMNPEFYRHATAGQMHSLTVAVPVEIEVATVIENRDLSSNHEEADTIIVQHTMTRCMVGEVVSVICDATDVFALLLHFVAEMKPNGQLCMCSTVKDRAVIDIMQSVKVHTSTRSACHACPYRGRHIRSKNSKWPELLGSRYMLLEIHKQMKLLYSYWLAMAKVLADVPA